MYNCKNSFIDEIITEENKLFADFPKRKALVLMSGGLDSCVTAKYAISKGFEVIALHVSYNQNTSKKEKEVMQKLCEEMGIKEILYTEILFNPIIRTSLIDNKETTKIGDLPSTYVPFRNGVMLSYAVAYAESLDIDDIFIGVMTDDYAGYPDCRKSFIKDFNKLLYTYGDKKNAIFIHAPLISYTKRVVIKKGDILGAPMHLTWSCYTDEDTHCGVCDSCVLRRKGFEEAGITDFTVYGKQTSDYDWIKDRFNKII